MQLLTHYNHVIVQSLIVHPVCDAERLIAAPLEAAFLSQTGAVLRYL